MAHIPDTGTMAQRQTAPGTLWVRIYQWVVWRGGWEVLGLLILFGILPFLAFYNLELNPRTWHDEGSTTSLARTLAEDGVYAIRSSDGYQSFGAVQSVGPTVVLPVAMTFRLFGIGLVQARLVAGTYMIFTTLLFFLIGRQLFGRRAALFATFFLLSGTSLRFMMYGRQLLGEVPAVGLFLAGGLALERALRKRSYGFACLAGLLIGAAIVTKSQYLVMAFGALGLLALLELFYYRLGTFKLLVVIGVVAAACEFAWLGWQFLYYGQATFMENAEKMRLMAQATTGFRFGNLVTGLRVLFGTDLAHFYYFWGFLALLYVGFSWPHKSPATQAQVFLVLFVALWLAYFLFWTAPWPRYAFPAMAVVVLFTGKLFDDLAVGLFQTESARWKEIRQVLRLGSRPGAPAMAVLGVLVALVSFSLWNGYQFQNLVRSDVLDKKGEDVLDFYKMQQLWAPGQLAQYLKDSVPDTALVETWERELHILTNHRYHFPDQSILTQVHAATYAGGTENYQLSSDYFSRVKPDYIIIGFTAREDNIYDMNYINQHYDLVKKVGYGDYYRYEVYRLK